MYSYCVQKSLSVNVYLLHFALYLIRAITIQRGEVRERRERKIDIYIYVYINENIISATFCGGGGGNVDGRSIEPIELARRKYTVHIDTLET